MKSRFWNKRIPSLLGIIFLIGGAFLTAYLVQHQIILFSQAAPTNIPRNITITNISDNVFSVVYTTSQSTTGSVILGSDPTKTDKLVLDDRDQASGTAKNYFVHHITIKNTSPDTAYSFFILSGTDVFGADENKTAFVLRTGKAITSEPSNQPPLTGKVADSTSADALVILTPENGASVSTLIKSDGTYFLPLNALRDSSSQSYLSLSQKSVLSFLFLKNGISSHVKAFVSQADPLPLIAIGQDYDFTTLSTLPSNSSSASSSATPTPPTAAPLPAFEETNDSQVVSLNVPTEGTPDDQPLLKGTGIPDETVSIEIHSDQVITDSVTVNKNGQWSYRPSTPLTPGVHTITIKSLNAKGLLQTITQSFTVYAEGSQSIEPSVSPTTSPTDTPTPTQAPLATPTPTRALPTSTPTPTLVSAFTPTPTIPLPTAIQATAAATITSYPSTNQPPATGSMSALLALGGGLATIFVGLLLFMSKEGRIR